jgi:hypothetical protein
MEINLIDFFKIIQYENYCIIKRGDIEKYKGGSDFDIFCFDIKSFSQKIITASQKYVESGYILKINDSRNNHWHVDLLKNAKIEIRFDLYSSMPIYKNINIKEGLFSSIIENKISESILLSDEKILVYYPALVDEIIIRYLEYIENYQLRPDKIKHLDYIVEKLDEKNKKEFLEKLHIYTSLPRDLSIKNKNNFLDLFNEIIFKIKITPFENIPSKAIKFIKNRL